MSCSHVAVRGLCVAVVCMLGLMSVSGVAPPASAETIEVSTDLQPLAFERLAAGAVLGDDGRIFVFGGYRYNYTALDQTTNTVMIYNITSGETSYGASMASGVAWPSCAKLPDGRIAVIGGYDSSVSNGTKAVRLYDPRTDTWTTNATAPVNISRAGTALGQDGKVYVFGPDASQNSTLIYDPVGDSWSYGADLAGSRSRYGSSAVAYNATAIYVMGGMQFQLIWFPPPIGVWIPVFDDTNYVDIYDPVADSWTVGPSLNGDKFYGGAAIAKDGRIHYYGGMGMFGTGFDDIEILDASTAGATWQISESKISTTKSSFGTVTDGYSRVFLVGGLEYPAGIGIANVEMLLTADVSEVNEIVITSPEDGARVNGTVEITVESKNLHSADVVMVDAYVDDDLLESQLGGGASEWTFTWNASGLALNSTHDLLVRAFFSDGSVSEDEASFVISEAVADDTVDERLAQIEEDLAAMMDDIAALAAGLAELSTDIQGVQSDLDDVQTDLGSLQASTDALQSQLDSLEDIITALETSMDADLAILSADVAVLHEALDALTASLEEMRTALDGLEEGAGLSQDELMDELGSLEDAIEDLNETVQGIEETSGGAGTADDGATAYAMTAMVLAALVLIVLVAGMIMYRKKT